MNMVERDIEINAPVEKIWQVLIGTDYIRQWDDVPGSFTDSKLSLGSKLVWELEDGHQSSVTVTRFEPESELKESLYVTRWPSPPSAYDISYQFRILNRQNKTVLKITVGDFEALGDKAPNYREASQEFVQTAGDKIKELAEAAERNS